ncbi:MAG: DPP IV N-terminal domain-containing protein [Chitinophagaceae bacterium]|nr:DPP IV N-terminal domain-containing protein [Chitinophagaceae bacterium]
MKKILLLLIISSACYAQQKNFTMQEAVLGMTTTFALKSLKQLQWMGESAMYSYIVSNDSENVIMRVDPANFEAKPVMTLQKMNQLLEGANLQKLASFPVISWISRNSFYIQHANKILIFNTEDSPKKPIEELANLPITAERIELNSDKSAVAYVDKYNLFIAEKEKSPIQLTQDGSKNLLYGTSVHQNEFGITGGIFWSANHNALAFYRMDQSMVEDYPVTNWNEVPAVTKMIKYPFAGRTSHQVTIGVYDIKTAQTIYLKTGEPKDQYLTNVTWSPDEKFIYVSILNRDQNHVWLNQYDAKTGDLVKTLFEETNEKYVEPQHPLVFLNDDASQFIWWSQRDGFMHLYLYKNDGSLIKQLTQGDWVVNEILGYQTKTGELIYTSSAESPLQKNVYSVNIKTAKSKLISTTLGTHTAMVSKDGNFMIDQYTNRQTPKNIEVINLLTKSEKRILTASNPLENYKLANIDNVNLFSSDSTLLYGKLMTPADFDVTQQYPVIVYLYNGPHVQLNKDAFPYSGNLWYDYLTQKGYIVFVMDGRGSANRGFNFESAIHRQLGTLEMEDQMVGVNYLKSLPYIDSTRLGIHGWSYGGFMTTSFMLRKPGVFKCGVAGGPVLDWSMYEIMYGERYMDTPEQNPEGYKNNLLLDKVGNLQGKLLMIHGTDDDVVVWQHSLKFVQACVKQGIQMDYFVYPSHPHNVRGKDRVHLMQKITDYFDQNL